MDYLFAIYMVSKFREQKAFPLILEIAALPDEWPEELLGDCITEALARFIVSTFNGDLAAIQRFIENPKHNHWARQATLNSLLGLVATGRLSRETVVAYLRTLFNSPLADDEMFATDLVNTASDLYPEELLSEIELAFDQGKIDTQTITKKWIRDRLQQGKKACLEKFVYSYSFHLPIDDVEKEMKWMGAFHLEKQEKSRIPNIQEILEDLSAIQEERAGIREIITDFFTENYPEEVEDQVYNPLIQKLQEDDQPTTPAFSGGEIAVHYQSFLVNGSIQNSFLCPLDIVSMALASEKILNLETVVAIRKMVKTNHVGLFRILAFKDDQTMCLLNVISGEKIDLHSSGGAKFDMHPDESIIGRYIVQSVEKWRDRSFACGNGNLFSASDIEMLLKIFAKSLPMLIGAFYSCDQNRQNAYDILEKDRREFEKHFGENPKTFHTAASFEAQLTNSPIHHMRDMLTNHPAIEQISELQNGASIMITRQGPCIVVDYITFKNHLPRYAETKNEEERKDFLPAFLQFLTQSQFPPEILLLYQQIYPDIMATLLQELEQFLDIQFENWDTFIRFWFPEYPEVIPSQLYLPDRLKQVFSSGKIGRNDPCICGSNQKFKKCCGR